jgi:hypothetical protein
MASRRPLSPPGAAFYRVQELTPALPSPSSPYPAGQFVSRPPGGMCPSPRSETAAGAYVGVCEMKCLCEERLFFGRAGGPSGTAMPLWLLAAVAGLPVLCSSACRADYRRPSVSQPTTAHTLPAPLHPVRCGATLQPSLAYRATELSVLLVRQRYGRTGISDHDTR